MLAVQWIGCVYEKAREITAQKARGPPIGLKFTHLEDSLAAGVPTAIGVLFRATGQFESRRREMGFFFIPGGSEERARAADFETLVAAGHTTAADDVQHWCFYFGKGEGKTVRVNMTPGGDLLTGALVVSSDESEVLGSVVKKVSVARTEASKKVGDFLNVIESKGYERYRFTEKGEGCRNWVGKVLRVWCDQGLVTEDGVGKAVQSMEKLWPEGTEAKEMAVGTFY